MSKKTRLQRNSEEKYTDELMGSVITSIKFENDYEGNDMITEIHLQKLDGSISILTMGQDGMYQNAER